MLIGVFVIAFFETSYSQNFTFDSIIKNKAILRTVFNDHKKFKLQIIYTQITRDKEGKASFKEYTYSLDSTNYFYCASLVKLPCSILALEKLNDLDLELYAYAKKLFFDRLKSYGIYSS